MSIKHLFMFLASCLFLIGTVHADEYPLTFEELDKDANGYITADEAKVRNDLRKAFKNIDSDADGRLNIAEYQAYEGRDRLTPPEDTETPEIGAAPY